MSLNIMATILRLSSDILDSPNGAPAATRSAAPTLPRMQLYAKIGGLPALCGLPGPGPRLFPRPETTCNLLITKEK
jgi:hypothetical protein